MEAFLNKFPNQIPNSGECECECHYLYTSCRRKFYWRIIIVSKDDGQSQGTRSDEAKKIISKTRRLLYQELYL